MIAALNVAFGLAYSATAAATAGSATVYEGYAAFYATLSQPLFTASDREEFVTRTAPSGRLRPFWSGAVSPGGQRHAVEMDGADLLIDGRRMTAAGGRRFGTETAAALENRARLYITGHYVCVEGVAPSASGTATRHTHVTLVSRPYSSAAQRYELPSLFGSCLGLRAGEPGKPVRFYQASYHYAEGQDQADGLIMQEYAIEAATFRKTRHRLRITFEDPGNFYRFSVRDEEP